MRISRHNCGSHMTGGRSPIQVQIHSITERCDGFLNRLRAFLARTIGAGGSQRTCGTKNPQSDRGIRNTDALRGPAR